MCYDYSKLSGRIKEKFGTQGRFAEAIRLSEHSVSAKLRGNAAWKQKEIIDVCKALDICLDDIPSYFFAVKVQN